MVKNPPVNAGDIRDTGLIPGSGRSLGVGHGNSLHFSSLENPIEREAWQAIVPGIAKSQTQLNNLVYMHAGLHADSIFVIRVRTVWGLTHPAFLLLDGGFELASQS